MTAISELITLRKAGEQCGGVSRETVRRWVKDGVHVGGVLRKLEAVRVGGRWMTTLAALEAFRAPEQPQSTAEQSRAAARLKGKK